MALGFYRRAALFGKVNSGTCTSSAQLSRDRQALYNATTTVETHRRNVMRKLGIHSMADSMMYAIREGPDLARRLSPAGSLRRPAAAHRQISDLSVRFAWIRGWLALWVSEIFPAVDLLPCSSSSHMHSRATPEQIRAVTDWLVGGHR